MSITAHSFATRYLVDFTDQDSVQSAILNCLPCIWILTQAPVLKECPDKILVTAVQCVFSMVQSFAVAMVAERDFSRWKLHFDVSLLAIFYAVSFAFLFFSYPSEQLYIIFWVKFK